MQFFFQYLKLQKHVSRNISISLSKKRLVFTSHDWKTYFDLPLVKALREKVHVVVVDVPWGVMKNKKGKAIRSGLTKVEEGLVLIQDADLEYNPRDYKKLLKNNNVESRTAPFYVDYTAKLPDCQLFS